MDNDVLGIQILETQEIERKRIAMDLHDSTMQSLTRLVHKAELCELLLDKDLERARLELTEMTKEIRGVINEMRSIIYNLQPVTLVDIGLKAAVEKLAEDVAEEYNLSVIVESEHEKFEISDTRKISLYRIIQECINNVIAHAKASRVIISLRYTADKKGLEVVINDNGCGFDLVEVCEKESCPTGHGNGLIIMKERTYLLNGEIEIKSSKEKGTMIKVVIPI